MRIVGIDCSFTSPSFVYATLNNKNLDTEDIDFIGFTSVKKFSDIPFIDTNTEQSKIYYYNKKDIDSDIEQYLIYSEELSKMYADVAAIEDYAFGCSVGQITKLAETAGALKVNLYQSNTPIRLYEIGNIKRFATGMGNADKFMMEEAFEKIPLKDRFDLSFLPLVKDKKTGNPKDNIVDAYFIMKFLQTELKVRRGIIKMQDLPDHQLKCFNLVTKSNPLNLPVRPFIQKVTQNA